MNIRAKEGFIDKVTGESVLAGQIIQRDDDRAKELVKAGVCEEFGPMQKTKPSKAKKTAGK